MMETKSYEPRPDWTALGELSDWELHDGNQDIRGQALVDASGESLGSIEELLVDCDEGRVAAVRLVSGRTFPVEPLVIEDTRVVLRKEWPDQTAAPVAAETRPTPPTAAPAPMPDRPIARPPQPQPFAEPKLQRGPIRVRRKAEPQSPVAAPRAVPSFSAAQSRRAMAPRQEPRSSKTLWDWNKIGVGAAVLGAAAGAALLRRKGKDEDDFEFRLETDENIRLIASSKVDGTAVYGRDGERLGEIDSFMVDKYTGQVAYAVMKLGGTFGFGSSLFPLPWSLLDYDVDCDGYSLDVTKEQFARAPKFQPSEEPEFDGDYRRLLLHHYGATI